MSNEHKHNNHIKQGKNKMRNTNEPTLLIVVSSSLDGGEGGGGGMTPTGGLGPPSPFLHLEAK